MEHSHLINSVSNVLPTARIVLYRQLPAQGAIVGWLYPMVDVCLSVQRDNTPMEQVVSVVPYSAMNVMAPTQISVYPVSMD